MSLTVHVKYKDPVCIEVRGDIHKDFIVSGKYPSKVRLLFSDNSLLELNWCEEFESWKITLIKAGNLIGLIKNTSQGDIANFNDGIGYIMLIEKWKTIVSDKKEYNSMVF